MTDQKLYSPPQSFVAQTRITNADYEAEYARSREDNEAYWGAQGKCLDWMRPYTKVKNVSWQPPEVRIAWYEDGTLNVAANCVDRHAASHPDRTALIWEPDDPQAEPRQISYAELKQQVSRLANVLRHHGVQKGDRVTIYMPMVPEATYAMLACARIGAIHSVVFGGFSPSSLAGRIQDCASDFVITADEGVRGGKTIPLKANVDEALKTCPDVRHVLVYQRTGGAITWHAPRDLWYHEAMAQAIADCPPQEMGAEDPLFILYTSGSTGKPKGVLHTTGGYLVYATHTFRAVFDLRDDDIFWCTADVGWITGHSYMVYGPLSCGATVVLFEGVPNFPDASRFWQVCDRHKVTLFYTAPTAIRALMREGDSPVQKTSRASLRLLGTVGEPINPEAWQWYWRVVGDKRCPIVDTWWQTETGGFVITPLPGATDLKPGSATRPFFGAAPVLLDKDGTELTGEATGALCLADSWPGQMRTVYGDHARFVETYFQRFPGYYCSGDGARRDKDGYWWITGRLDDVINVSGHRLGTAEIESALVAHEAVAEAAVVGFAHEIKGQGIYAFVTLIAGREGNDALAKELIAWVRQEIGPIATPDFLQWAAGLPKTRSGKIMRRILRKIAEGDHHNLGDTSTLADPTVVQTLIATRQNL